MVVIGRRNLLLGGAAFATVTLAGCGNGGASGTSADDMAIGDANAPVTLVEYGSTMCPHCRDWHNAVWEELKANYIDTGKVRFVFREMLTPVDPQNVIPTITLAEYQIARCGGATPEQYFSRLSVLFEQQAAMYAAGSRAGVEARLMDIGAAAGLPRDTVSACINDPAGAERMQRIQQLANRDNVTGTPAFFLDGELLNDPSIFTYEGIARVLDAAIAAKS